MYRIDFGRVTMNNKTKTYLFETGKVFLVSSLVILFNVVVGWMMINKWFSFYLAVFFFLFIPTWLVAFGVAFQSKWTWYSMLTGSFLAVFLLSWIFFASAEDMTFRLGNSFFFAIVGGFLSLWGWLIRYLSCSVIQTVRQETKKEQDANNRSTPLGM